MDSVYETEKRNEQSSRLGINTWRNPSRVLVETALEKWRSNGLRADNTSVVCVMLDPPNKRNMFKFCRSPPTNSAETIESLESARTIFDYSTSEAYNLDFVNSGEGLVRQNASYDLLSQNQNSFYQHQLASNVDGRYFQASGSHQTYSSGYNSYETSYGYHIASTSTQHYQVQPGSLTYQTSSNESAFVKACCRNNFLLANANEEIPYHSSYEQHREMYENMALRPYPPLHYAYRPVPQRLPLPSLHANLYDHQGYLQSSYKPMERYNYLRPTPEEVAALHNEDDEKESDLNAMDFSDEESDDEETDTKEPEPMSTSTANSEEKESDNSIQIFEISSSSFHANEDTDHSNDDEASQFQKNPAKSNNKENSERSPQKKKVLTVTRGRIYLTRQTDRKMRSGNTGVTKTIGREKLQRRITRNIRKAAKNLTEQRPSTTSLKTLPDISRGARKLPVKSSENKPVEKEAQPQTLIRVLRSADTTFKKQSIDEIVNIRSLRSNSSNSNVMETVEKPATRKRTATLFDNNERNKDRMLK